MCEIIWAISALVGVCDADNKRPENNSSATMYGNGSVGAPIMAASDHHNMPNPAFGSAPINPTPTPMVNNHPTPTTYGMQPPTPNHTTYGMQPPTPDHTPYGMQPPTPNHTTYGMQPQQVAPNNHNLMAAGAVPTSMQPPHQQAPIAPMHQNSAL